MKNYLTLSITWTLLGLFLPGQLIGDTSEGREIPAIIDSVAPALMEEANVPGISVALIQNHEVVWSGQYGVTSALDPKPVTDETVFEAASMSKPAFGFVVLRLVEEGLFDLDKPLVEYLGAPYIEDEPLHEKITGRMVLSHRTGYPNWRRGNPLVPAFVPGTGYSYSGEGFLFLQRTIEHLTERSVEDLMREYLFEPLGMSASSYIWREDYNEIASEGHTRDGELLEGDRRIYRTPNTAYSLYTTPNDYAKFLIAMMRTTDQEPLLPSVELRLKMLQPITLVESRQPLDRGDGNTDGPVYFGLGWRIDTTPTGNRICHSGSNRTGFRCYSEFIPDCGNGIVIMTNSVGGVSVWQGVMAAVGVQLDCSSSLSESAGN